MCQDEKCVHKLTEAIAQRKSKSSKDTDGRRRYSLDGKQTANKSASLISRAEDTLVRRNSTSGIFVSNIQNRPKLVSSTQSLVIYQRFRTQMVVLQRTTPNALPVSPIALENQRPHLLEICSNCNWEPIRSQLLGRMSAVCSVMGDFPPEMAFTIEQYFVAVLPKPDKTTPIPPNLQPVLQTQEMFAIRLKISPVGFIDPNQPPSLSELNSSQLSETSVKNLEQISKAPTLASMLALSTPLYATPQVGISGFKTISLGISDGKIVGSTQSVQQIPRGFVPDPVVPGPIEPIEIVPISDDSSPDGSPGSRHLNEDTKQESTGISVSGKVTVSAEKNDDSVQSGSVDSDSQGEETVTVTIDDDEDMLETGLSQGTDFKTDDDCTSQEGETVTVTIDEEMVDPSNEADKNIEPDNSLSSATNEASCVLQTKPSPTFTVSDDSGDDSQPDVLSYPTESKGIDEDKCKTAQQLQDNSEIRDKPDSQMDSLVQNLFDEGGLNNSLSESRQNGSDLLPTGNVATDEDGSQDSVSVGLPDLRPSSSCTNATEQLEEEHQSSETETLDQPLLPDWPSDCISQKSKSTSPTSSTISKPSRSNEQQVTSRSISTTQSPSQAASICTTSQYIAASVTVPVQTQSGSKMSVSSAKVQIPSPFTSAEKKSPIMYDRLPLRVESGSFKLVTVSGIPKHNDNMTANQKGNGERNVEAAPSVLRPIVLRDKQPVVSVPGLTLIPVTAVHDSILNGNSTKSYIHDKIAVPVSVICTKVNTAKSSSVTASGVRRNSTGAAIPTKSPTVIMRSPSADLHSKLAQTLSHFTPVTKAKVSSRPSMLPSSPPGDVVISSLNVPSMNTKVAGIDTTKAFIPLDQLPISSLSGLHEFQGSSGSAFRPLSIQNPTSISKNGRQKATRTSIGASILKETIRKGETPPSVVHVFDDDGNPSDEKAKLPQVILSSYESVYIYKYMWLLSSILKRIK